MASAILTVERLSGEELAALDAYRQGVAMNELMAEMVRMHGEIEKAITRHATARKNLLIVHREDAESFAALKGAEIDSKARLDVLRERVKMLRESKSILQTLMRATSI